VHACRVEGECVKERLTRLKSVAVAVSRGDVALVAEPDLDARPVDLGVLGDAEHRPVDQLGDRATGEDQRRHVTVALPPEDLVDQPVRDVAGEVVLVADDLDLGRARGHDAALRGRRALPRAAGPELRRTIFLTVLA
jgi:hypothetical protein